MCVFYLFDDIYPLFVFASEYVTWQEMLLYIPDLHEFELQQQCCFSLSVTFIRLNTVAIKSFLAIPFLSVLGTFSHFIGFVKREDLFLVPRVQEQWTIVGTDNR